MEVDAHGVSDGMTVSFCKNALGIGEVAVKI